MGEEKEKKREENKRKTKKQKDSKRKPPRHPQGGNTGGHTHFRRRPSLVPRSRVSLSPDVRAAARRRRRGLLLRIEGGATGSSAGSRAHSFSSDDMVAAVAANVGLGHMPTKAREAHSDGMARTTVARLLSPPLHMFFPARHGTVDLSAALL